MPQAFSGVREFACQRCCRSRRCKHVQSLFFSHHGAPVVHVPKLVVVRIAECQHCKLQVGKHPFRMGPSPDEPPEPAVDIRRKSTPGAHEPPDTHQPPHLSELSGWSPFPVVETTQTRHLALTKSTCNDTIVSRRRRQLLVCLTFLKAFNS